MNGVEWTATHAFFANMGGFAVSFAAAGDEVSEMDGPVEDNTTSVDSYLRRSFTTSFELFDHLTDGNDAPNSEKLTRKSSGTRHSSENDSFRRPVSLPDATPTTFGDPVDTAETDMRSIESVISLDSLREIGIHAYRSEFVDGHSLDSTSKRNKKLAKTIGDIG